MLGPLVDNSYGNFATNSKWFVAVNEFDFVSIVSAFDNWQGLRAVEWNAVFGDR